MTVVFSAVTPEYIVMANDSVVTETSGEQSSQYVIHRKHFLYGKIGCVTLWGDRVGVADKLLRTLEAWKVQSNIENVENLAVNIHKYLIDECQLHTDNPADDSGIHIAGFMEDGSPRLYHVFWNSRNVPTPNAQWAGRYVIELYKEFPVTQYLFNGRNDLVYNAILLAIQESKQGAHSRFPHTPEGICGFACSLLRFTTGITKQVGPPFFVHLLRPGREPFSKKIEDEPKLYDTSLFHTD